MKYRNLGKHGLKVSELSIGSTPSQVKHNMKASGLFQQNLLGF